MLEVKSVNEVFKIINDNFSGYNLDSCTVSISDAIGRISAVELAATDDIPGFNRSSVDGYAVISSDTFGALESLPAMLHIIGEVKMGDKPLFSLEVGQAAYVPTGGELPMNADAVVMIEYTENLNDGFIYIDKASAPGNNVVYKGDDVRIGDAVIRAGTSIRPQDVGVMAAMGYPSITVQRKLNVGIISTGNEIIGVDEKLTGAQVRDVNSHLLYAGLVSLGVQPMLYGIIKDSFKEIKQAVENALIQSDIVLISGGSSAGVLDETSRVIDSLGSPGVLVHGIAVKPGKPTILGRIGDKAVVGLPGHPAAAYTVFNIFVGHLLNVMNGSTKKLKSVLQAEMSCNYPSNNGREEFLPVSIRDVDGRLYADPIFGKSGLISLLTSANGYVHINRGSEGIDRGTCVEVVLY